MPASEDEFLIDFDPEKCTQCHGCEIACKSWRKLPYGVQYRRVLNLWRGEYPEVKNATLSLACLHCAEPACAAVCPEDAISKSERDGRVVVDEALCNGCRLCADACSFGVPQFGETGVMQKCDLCHGQQSTQVSPPCVDTCPGEALSYIAVAKSEKKRLEDKIECLKRSAEVRRLPGKKRAVP
jgi:Fe-S-cluster-containing dehydrogenase component